MVVTRYGIVATSHVQASQAGAQILARGGSAADAAIAANAVLGVTEPMMNGIGGDLFALYWDAKTGKLYGLNASGWAPQGLTISHLKALAATSMPQSGIDTVTVPGAVAGWNTLHERFGRLPWKDIFQAAIFYADKGYPVPELIHGYWEDSVEDLLRDAESRRVFLHNDKPPALGEIFQNHDLAKALRLIAQQGANSFYRGEIAQAILRTSQTLGGTMSEADLAEFAPEWVEPIIEGGPVGYFSTLPIRAIVDRINNAHIPAAISNSAGAHLCNRLFYSVMHTISIEGLRIKAGFIHVPYLHDQAINKYPDVPSLSRDSIVEAVRLAIEVSLSLLTPHA